MSVREKFFATWAPLTAAIGVIGAASYLGFTQSSAIVQAFGTGFSDPSQLGIRLALLNTGLLTTTALFTVGRWWAIHDSMIKTGAEIGVLRVTTQQLQGDMHEQNGKTDHNAHVCDELRARNDALEAKLMERDEGGHQEYDHPDLWTPIPNSYYTSFGCKNHKECKEVIRPGGLVEFQPTDWVVKNWVRRVAVGTMLADWRIIIHVPEVSGPFEQNAMLPARKYSFLFDYLAQICERQGVAYSFANIRIVIVREVEPRYRNLSISLFTRQTMDGAEKVAVTYQRPPTDKIEAPYGDKVLVHRGEIDRRHYLDVCDKYFHGGNAVHLTVNELREAVRSGLFPDIAPSDVRIHI